MDLTATENVRVCKFSNRHGLDDETSEGMFNLFGITKKGKNDIASALIVSAHDTSISLCAQAIAYLKPLKLVMPNGTIPKSIREAIKTAVHENFLIIDQSTNPYLKPAPDFLEPEPS